MSKVPQPKPAYVSTEIPGYETYDSVSLKPAGNVIYDSQQLYEVSEATSLDKTYTFEENTIPEPQIPPPISPILKQKQDQLQLLREQEDRERQRIKDEIAQREREQFAKEQRDKEEREQREREQREREQKAQREKEQREREQREREQREKEQSAFIHPSSSAQTALSALTTIVVNAAEPSTAQVSHQAETRLPHQQSETRLPAEVIIQKPLIVDEAITTTISTSYNEIHEMREQLIEEHDPGTGELNNEVIETDYTSTYIPDEEYSQINSKQQEPERDEESELSEEDRLARIQFAGNYTSTLVLNAYNKYKLENSSEYKITPMPLSDDLKHLLDAEQLTESDLASAQLVVHDYSSYNHKKFSFNKQLTQEQLEVKQPTLAQIIECLAQKKLNKANEEHDESAKSEQCDEQSHLYNAPYSLGLRLKSKQSPLEIGNHVISRVEPKSVAEEAGIKANSVIIKINDVNCEDKTHEFVLFYLNYLLRKNACSTIELVIAEPLPLTHSSVVSTDSAVVVTKESATSFESSNKSSNENLKSILRDIFSIKQPAYNYTLEQSSSATAQHLNTSFDHSSNIDDSSMSTFTLSNQNNENSNLINIIREIKSINSNLNTNYYNFNNNVRDDAVHLENSHYLITNSFVSKPAEGAVSSSLDYLPYLPTNTSMSTSSTPSFPLNEFNQAASSESGVENLKTIILEIKASNNKHEILLPLLPTIANTASNTTTTTTTIIPQNTQAFYEVSHGLASQLNQFEQVSTSQQYNQYTNMNYVYETQHLPIDIQQNFENKEYYAQSNYENVSAANSHLLTILNEAMLSNSNKVGHAQHEYLISDAEKGRYDEMNIQINTALNKKKTLSIISTKNEIFFLLL